MSKDLELSINVKKSGQIPVSMKVFSDVTLLKPAPSTKLGHRKSKNK